MAEPQVVCVLGMHRSGTSAIARILNLLGVYLGPPEHMMPPKADNPKGFWEHQRLHDLNEELLSRLGGSWHEPPVFPSGWETAPDLADLRQRAHAILQQDFATADLWGWKDPRTCLTLPFWQRLLPPMRYVVCLRNPIDAARSLESRNSISFQQGVGLWLTHVTSALLHTAGHRRLFVFYEDVMNHWDHELWRLAAFLDASDQAARPETQDAVREYLEEDSRHHRSEIVGTADEPRLAFPAKALYLVLRAYVSRRDADPRGPGELDATWQAALDHFSQSAQTDSLPYQIMATQLAERDQAVGLLRARLAEQDTAFQSERLARQQEAHRLRTEAEQRRLEAERLGLEMETVQRSKSWRLTAPLRRLAVLVRRLRAVPGSANATLDGLRENWYRATWDCLPLKALAPVAVDAGSRTPPDATPWASPARLEHQVRHALLAPPPTRVTFRFTVPPRAILRTFLSLTPEAGEGAAGVDFSVSATSRTSRRRLERTWRILPTTSPPHRQWRERRVGFQRFADQEVELTFSTSVATGASAPTASAAWGDPVILSRKPARDIWALGTAYLKLHGLRGALRRIRIGVTSASTASVGFGSRPSPGALARSRAPITCASPARALLERAGTDKLISFLADPSATLAFPSFADPVVSVVIPTYNRAEYLCQCLDSILAHTDLPFEVIVVDDASGDATPRLLEKLQHVTCVRNETNLDFIRTCNKGAGLAKGRYLLFLNNDVTVTPGWLSTLVATMERYPNCGAVHGKLVRPDGTLQEAGSIVWRDGSALGYGRDDDPARPEYSYLREVDYGSGACLLVRTELFQKLGGFDELYLPAYYEDADLCFGVRRLGYKVVFQPDVSVVHYEYGTRSFERAEALCQANQPRFAEKWAGELQTHQPSGEILRGRDRRDGPRILVMDDQIPAPHLGSGFPRAYKMLELLSDLGFVITFVPLALPTPHQPATARLQQMGVEVFYGSPSTPQDLLRDRAGAYDFLIISRPHNAAKFLRLARQCFPDARIVYDAEALFCVRDFLFAELNGRALTERQKQRVLRRELDIMTHADVVITVSEAERDLILEHQGHPNVVVWGHAQRVSAPLTPFAQRSDLLFVGGFLDGHPPNTDAVRHFATRLFPRIRRRLPDCRFVIVGAQPPPSVQDLASAHIVVTGYVADLTEYYEACRVFVVPLRFGAGISLKLLEAMGHGIPAVASTVGAAGLALEDGRDALIARSEDEFVDKVVHLYEDETLWSTVQGAAQDYIRLHCSDEVMRTKLAEALECRERPGRQSLRPSDAHGPPPSRGQ